MPEDKKRDPRWLIAIKKSWWSLFGSWFWQIAVVILTLIVVFLIWVVTNGGICLDSRFCPRWAVLATPTTPRILSTSIPSSGPSSSSSSDYAFSEDLEQQFYRGHQINLASYPPAGSNEVYVIHGDLLNDGRCHIIVSRHGENPSVLTRSKGGFQLMKVTGSDTAIEREVTRIQDGAASYAKTTCPRIPH